MDGAAATARASTTGGGRPLCAGDDRLDIADGCAAASDLRHRSRVPPVTGAAACADRLRPLPRASSPPSPGTSDARAAASCADWGRGPGRRSASSMIDRAATSNCRSRVSSRSPGLGLGWKVPRIASSTSMTGVSLGGGLDLARGGERRRRAGGPERQSPPRGSARLRASLRTRPGHLRSGTTPKGGGRGHAAQAFVQVHPRRRQGDRVEGAECRVDWRRHRCRRRHREAPPPKTTGASGQLRGQMPSAA